MHIVKLLKNKNQTIPGTQMLVFDHMMEGCQIIGYDWKYIYLNDAAEVHNRRPNEELLGKGYTEIWPGVEETEVYRAIKKSLNERKYLQMENEFVFPDGTTGWFDLKIQPVPEGVFILSIDISDRKIAESALLESEERFRSLYENVSIGIYRTTADGKILMANPAMVSMLGFDSFEQLSQRNLDQEGYEPDYPRSKFLETIEKQGKIAGLESAWRHKDGRIIYVRESAMAVRDADGMIKYYDGTAEDITERKLIEQALIQSEDKFRYIFDHSVIAKSLTSTDGGVLVNDAFCKLLGYSPEEFAKLKWPEFTHPDDFEITENIIKSTLSGNSDSTRFVKRYLRKDGSVIWADVSTIMRRDNKGNPVYFMTSVNDITENRRAEAELKLQSEIMSHMIEAVYLVRMEDGIIVYTNSRFEELFGYEPGEMTGRNVSIVNAPTEKSPEETAGEIMKDLAEKGLWRGEVYNIKKDGTPFWSHANVTLFDHSKFGRVLVAVQEDITDRKKAESQIKRLNEELEERVILRTEQLEAVNKELESFSYSVSHDLRAPLRAVHGYTKILLEEYSNLLDDEGKRICGIISGSATQMGQLIDDLLSFSRIGRSDLSHSMIDMKKMVGVLFEGITSPTERGRIKLKVVNLQNAYGDVKLMGQVWTNLISNAIKYTSKNETSEILIGSKVSDKMVTYFVKDNGVGFDMQYAHKLFGVFQRLHSESEFEGNGVGLAIVQRIILKHGGKVSAEAEVGKGATFYFSLPIREEIASLRSQ